MRTWLIVARGVLLMPSGFKWEEAIVITQPPWKSV